MGLYWAIIGEFKKIKAERGRKLMKMVSKNIFLEGQTCLTRGWYLRSSDIQIPLTQADQFRIDTGVEIGEMARSLYPQGTLVNERNNISNY